MHGLSEEIGVCCNEDGSLSAHGVCVCVKYLYMLMLAR
jgi:hypothetical protein